MTELLEMDDTEVSLPDNAPPKRKRGRPPGSVARTKSAITTVQFTALLASGLSMLSAVIALRAQHAPLMLTDREASAIAKPLASIISKTNVYAKYGKHIAESNDYIALGMALFGYGTRVWQQSQELAVRRRQELATYGIRPSTATSNEERAESDGGLPSNEQSTPSVQFGNIGPSWKRD
jgi:hypothetical protein